jgi:hypothetical protein
VFGQIGITCHELIVTPNLTGDHEAVVKTITASNGVKSTGKNAVLDTFDTVFHGFSNITKGAVDADWSAQCPTACIAEEIRKSTSFNSVPVIDALGNTAGCLRHIVPVATLFAEIHQLNFLKIDYKSR